MSYKTFWALFGAAIGLGSATIPLWFGVPWWIVELCIVAGSCIAIRIAGLAVRYADCFDNLKQSQKDYVLSLVRLGVGSYSAWAAVFVYKPQMWLIWATVLLALVLLIYWTSQLADHKLRKERRAIPVPYVALAAPIAIGDQERIADFAKIMAKSDHSRVRTLKHEAIEDDGKFLADQFLIQVPPSSK